MDQTMEKWVFYITLTFRLFQGGRPSSSCISPNNKNYDNNNNRSDNNNANKAKDTEEVDGGSMYLQNFYRRQRFQWLPWTTGWEENPDGGTFTGMSASSTGNNVILKPGLGADSVGLSCC